MKKFISKYLNNLNKFVALLIIMLVLISGFSFSTESVKAAESDKAITAFIVPVQARAPFEYYNTGDDTGEAITSSYWAVQTFTPSTGHIITSVKVKIYNGGGATGVLTASIRAVDEEGKPTGSDLCSGTKNITEISTDPTWYEINLGSGTALATSTQYALQLKGGTDYVAWADDATDPTYAGGSWIYSTDSGASWTILTDRDFMFEDWGEEEMPTTSIAIINESAKTIALTMPYGADVTALVPTITITGTSTSPASGVANDFTNPQIYTVIAADSSTTTYAVTVTVAAIDDKAITGFTVPGQAGATTINESAKTIALTMPYGTDVTALVPTITIAGKSVSPASGVAHDFTATSTYTVIAADSSTQAYAVTVTVALNPAKAITAFTVSDQAGTTTIDESAKTIALTMPYGTDVTALVPTITITGASVSPASATTTNFSSPVIYTVTAENSSTQDYTVTVTVNPASIPSGGGGTYYNPAKAITAFTVPGQAGTTTINESTKTIALTMPYGTDVTALVPTITIVGASVSPASGVARNFTTSSIYTVTAENLSTQNYTVTVNIAPAILKTGRETDWFIKEVKRTDIFLDGKIDVLDFNALMVNWGKEDVGNPADINQDGLVDVLDFNLLIVYWGKLEPQS